MKTKTYTFKGRIYTEIPSRVADVLKINSGDEIEFKEVYDNLFLILPSKAAERSAGDITGEEIAIIKQMSNLRHYDRTREKVSALLDGAERKLFDQMFDRKILFTYTRTGKELVGIDKKYFKYVIGEKHELVEKLNKDGYIVLEDEGQAKILNDKLKQEKVRVRGIRAFDKRYYIVSAEKLDEIETKLEKILKKEKSLKTISSELILPEDLCRAAVEILREDGKIIEKRKNTYMLA